MVKKKTIQISVELHNELRKLMEGSETFEDIFRDFIGMERLNIPRGAPLKRRVPPAGDSGPRP